jgi:hypothetical protein
LVGGEDLLLWSGVGWALGFCGALMRVLESAWRDQPDTRTARVEPGCFVFGCGDRI